MSGFFRYMYLLYLADVSDTALVRLVIWQRVWKGEERMIN